MLIHEHDFFMVALTNDDQHICEDISNNHCNSLSINDTSKLEALASPGVVQGVKPIVFVIVSYLTLKSNILNQS